MGKASDEQRDKLRRNANAVLGCLWVYCNGEHNGIGLAGKDLDDVGRAWNQISRIVNSADVVEVAQAADPFKRFLKRAGA